ncbi:HNH endonuclease signature motif containing protein [Nitrosomonas sp. Nm132]|jgi:5-methylcytosine-specific restriction protein A|uniref:HNH endonuclease n=1 Tax=Nitrosomonas sp. Nm132 TaxID=1881053 RepID=UPI00088243BC|nr:HNH endonuclease signature motif containing protein [Nitrosomonas sp. Nm132]SDH48989.1 HNH endonuclease [Nitrosomonas sp. Nm132]
MSGFEWETELNRWLNSRRDISAELANSIIAFFEVTFEHTNCPERAWFGVHTSRASLVVGGIYLAAIQRSGEDQGFWLLVDQQAPPIENIEYRPVKSTQKSRHPLIWAHSVSLEIIPKLLDNKLLWNSFSSATEKIFASPIASDKDSIQERRKKTRLSEFWKNKTEKITNEQFQNSVRAALLDTREARRKRLENTETIPNKIKIASISFTRNPDVVAEVLLRANGYCEHCNNPAPFIRRADNTPYLEVHHIKMLAEGGEDTVANAVALCPNCHRQAHYS